MTYEEKNDTVKPSKEEQEAQTNTHTNSFVCVGGTFCHHFCSLFRLYTITHCNCLHMLHVVVNI